MARSKFRWAAGMAVVLIPLGLLGMHASAQQTEKSEKMRGNVDQAREMAKLIQQGQLNLRDAAEVAERHLKGTALEASAAIEPTVRARPGDPGAAKEQPAGQRLVYTVSLFASEELKSIRVDALTKKVIDE